MILLSSFFLLISLFYPLKYQEFIFENKQSLGNSWPLVAGTMSQMNLEGQENWHQVDMKLFSSKVYGCFVYSKNTALILTSFNEFYVARKYFVHKWFYNYHHDQVDLQET